MVSSNQIYFSKSRQQAFCMVVLSIICLKELFSARFICLSHTLRTFLFQPAKRHAYADDNVFTPVERELVFDIVSRLFFMMLTIF